MDNKPDLDLSLRSEHRGLCALHFGIENRRISVIKTLLERGADPNACDAVGDNCFIYNVKGSSRDCLTSGYFKDSESMEVKERLQIFKLLLE